jgi:hypothetical protein
MPALRTLLLACALALTSVAARAGSRLEIAAGAFNAIDQGRSPPAAAAQVELSLDLGLPLDAALGIEANASGGAYAYAGASHDFRLGRWVVTPLAGVGRYWRGSGKDLGSPLEFRLSAGVARETPSGIRVGVKFVHLSNAYTGRINPGDEELLLAWSAPL